MLMRYVLVIQLLDVTLSEKYKIAISKHNEMKLNERDAGFDIFQPMNNYIDANDKKSIKLGIKCAMYRYDGMIKRRSAFFLYARSSMGKNTNLRLANSVGIIDKGYRGELGATIDNISNIKEVMDLGNRYLQICAPSLDDFEVVLETINDDTMRGEKGFGSSGK